jgi:tRNA pseudouridine38-40 synthase
VEGVSDAADAEGTGTPSPGAAGDGVPARDLRLDLAYDGAGFLGWQRQARGRTVQAVVEAALERLLGEPTRVVAAGRTDAGVRALSTAASFSTRSRLPAGEIERALDALLPDDVGVLAVSERPGFHALRDARWKWYRYEWLLSRLRDVHARARAWRVPVELDVVAMAAAAARLEGTHDFASFQSHGSPRRSTVRTVAAARLSRAGRSLALDVVGDGFLYGMVRAIAGTLVEVGRGRRDAASVEALLAARDRRAAGPSAPPHGLSLVAVGYAGDAPPDFVGSAAGALLESGRAARALARDAEVDAVRIITGRHVEVTEAIKRYANEKIDKLERIHGRMTKVEVTLDASHDRTSCEIVVATTRHARLVGKAESTDLYAAIDAAEDKLVKQLVKFKERLTDHHRGEAGASASGAGGPAPGGGPYIEPRDKGPAPEEMTYEQAVEKMRDEDEE